MIAHTEPLDFGNEESAPEGKAFTPTASSAATPVLC